MEAFHLMLDPLSSLYFLQGMSMEVISFFITELTYLVLFGQYEDLYDFKPHYLAFCIL